MTHVSRRAFLAGGVATAGLTVLPACLAPDPRPVTPPSPAGRAMDEEGRLAFLRAVQDGRLELVRAALADRPALAAATDELGRSALVLAYCAGHADVAAAILEHEPELSAVEAVMIPDWDRATELIEADRASLFEWHAVGGTLLYAAARAGGTGLWRLQEMGADADGNPRGHDGVTPAYGALECADLDDARHAIVALLSNGAHVNAPQRDGDTLLHQGARRGSVEIVRYLLRRGADVRAIDGRGRTARRVAAEHGHEEVEALLASPGRVARDDMTMRYALDADGRAVQWPDLSDVDFRQQGEVTGLSHRDTAQVRKIVGDDPRRAFAFSTQRELTVEAASHTGNRDCALFLLDQGVPMSLCTAISVGDLARARALLTEHPGVVHERGPHDFAPMWYAAIGEAGAAAAELLLEHGCPVDQESRGTTALHWAAARGRRELVAFLAERGARLDAVGYMGDRTPRTPLEVAESGGRDATARLLRDLGAT